MIEHNDHIDQLIREKMQAFEATPPPHVWEGVMAGLEANKAAKSGTTRKLILLAALALLLAFLGWLLLSPFGGIWAEGQSHDANIAAENLSANQSLALAMVEKEVITEEAELMEPSTDISSTTAVGSSTPEKSDAAATPSMDEVADVQEDNVTFTTSDYLVEEAPETEVNQSVNYTSLYQSFLDFRPLYRLNLSLSAPTLLAPAENILGPALPPKKPRSNTPSGNKGRWSVFTGIASEFTTTGFDSVTVMNGFSVHFEPAYYFNKHWFVRSGLGMAYTRDRGFAQLDYISNEYVGSYNDVYNVTFDSVNGQVVPTYYTKTVEVWDSIRHLVVSEVTNRYAYAQLPLFVGYNHPGTRGSVGWYVYGGPIFNFRVGRWIDKPLPAENYIEILDLQNKLPERKPFYMQLGLGVGIEYKLTDKISMAIEPGYRYYLNSIYNKEGYKKPISAFSVKVGAVIRLK